MNSKGKKITKAELAVAIKDLVDTETRQWADAQGRSKYYSTGDVMHLTGWSRAYIIRMEKRGCIPKSKRVGASRGNPDWNAKCKPRAWDKSDLKLIMGFAKQQGLNRAARHRNVV